MTECRCPDRADLERRLERAEAVCRAIKGDRTHGYEAGVNVLHSLAAGQRMRQCPALADWLDGIADAYSAYLAAEPAPQPEPEPPHEWHAGDLARVVDEPTGPCQARHAGKLTKLRERCVCGSTPWWLASNIPGGVWEHNLRPLTDDERREYHGERVRKAVRQALETGNHVQVLYDEGSMNVKCIAASGNLWSSKDNRVVAAHRVTAVEVRDPGEWRTVELD